jgi:glutamine amidotransferase
VEVTSDTEKVFSADRIVFPGQGAARDCMHELRAHGLDEVVREVSTQKPFLGICMGMQVLVDFSEENMGTDCLGIYPGKVLGFSRELEDSQTGLRLKIPHMGWNQVHQTCDHPLWSDIEQDSRFYFVHSYYVDPVDKDLVTGITEYGHEFTSVIARDNVFAIQAHPEKSAAAGLQLLSNFTRWNGESN